MARINGTRWADQIVGTDGDDVIYGRRGEDVLGGGLGSDTIFGGDGNDYIYDWSGSNQIDGGRGSDVIFFVDGTARGGLGNDQIGVYGGGTGTGIGGRGDDSFEGTGAFWGDAGPGAADTFAGADKFLMYADADAVWAHGGAGADRFYVALDYDGAPDLAIINDFHPGEDRLQVYAQPPDGESAADLFATLDANSNSILEWSDSLSGGGVYVDMTINTMYLVAGPAVVVIQGATQIAASDWLTDFGVT